MFGGTPVKSLAFSVLALACGTPSVPSKPSRPPRVSGEAVPPPAQIGTKADQSVLCDGVQEETSGTCIPVSREPPVRALNCLGDPEIPSSAPLRFVAFELDAVARPGSVGRVPPEVRGVTRPMRVSVEEAICACLDAGASYVPPAHGATLTFHIDADATTFTREPTVPDDLVGCIAGRTVCSSTSRAGCTVEYHLTASDYQWIGRADGWSVGVRVVEAGSPFNRAMAGKILAYALPLYRKCLPSESSDFYVGGRLSVGKALLMKDVRSDRRLTPWAGDCCGHRPVLYAPEAVEKCVLDAHYGLMLGAFGDREGLPAEIAFSIMFHRAAGGASAGVPAGM